MSVSSRKRAANRANAQKSTGAVTPQGKAIVSQNSVRHGLTGQFSVLPWESQQDYDNLLKQFIKDEKPVGAAEVELVVKMAEHTWMSKRALKMQNACISTEPSTPEQEARGDQPIGVLTSIDRYIRYHTAHDRAYLRASKELRERRKERQLEERGFASQKRAEAEEQRKVEKHQEGMALKKVHRQIAEVKLGKALAQVLPPDFAAFAPPQPLGLPNLPFSTGLMQPQP
jgi:hypothetical protein